MKKEGFPIQESSQFEPNESIEKTFQQIKTEAMETAKKCGLISEIDGNIIFHKEKNTESLRAKMLRYGINYRDAIKYIEVTDPNTGALIPLVTLPRNKEEVISGVWQKGLYEYSDLAPTVWTSSIITEEGVVFSMFEIQIIKILRNLGFYRNEKGILVCKDTDDKEIKFSADYIRKNANYTIPSPNRIRFSDRPLEMIEKYGQRLIDADIFRLTDFQANNLNIDKDTFAYTERKLNQVYVSIKGSVGYVEYYLGRGKFVGTEIKREEGQVLMMLDKDTAGIFGSKHGGDKRLLAYFKLASEEETSNLYNKIRENDIKESKLASYAKLGGDFMDGRIKAYEPDVFCPQKKDESASDYAKRMTKMNDQTYQFEVFRPMMQEAGVRIEEISWENQMRLFGSILEQKDRSQIINFTKNFGVNGVITFLSLEFDRSLGVGILKIGEQLPPEDAKKIFAKYSELVLQLDKVGSVLEQTYNKEGSEEEIIKIKEALLHKGKDLLSHFADLLAKDKEVSTEEVLEHLKNIQAEALTFFLAFKTLKEDEELPPLEEIKGLSLETIKGGDISPEDLVAMEHIYQENYSDKEEILPAILKKFQERSQDPKTKFYILKHDGVVNAFAGFTDEGDSLHAHSINVDPSLRGLSIGSVLIEKTLDQEAKANILKAECFTSLPISAKYIEDGFIANGLDKYGEHSIMKILRDDTKMFETKGKSKEDFVKEYLEFAISGGDGLCDKGNYFIAKAPSQAEMDMTYLDDGLVLTRYFSYSSNNKTDWYAVFEKGNLSQ